MIYPHVEQHKAFTSWNIALERGQLRMGGHGVFDLKDDDFEDSVKYREFRDEEFHNI